MPFAGTKHQPFSIVDRQESERRALGYLAGRLPFKSHDDGDTLVPEAALTDLAREGISFVVKARYN